jgi:hypothetical protein
MDLRSLTGDDVCCPFSIADCQLEDLMMMMMNGCRPLMMMMN